MIRLPLFVLALPLLISLIHPYSSHAQDERSSGDPIVIKLIQLDYADAKELASVLAPLLSEEGRIVPYQSANSLIIKGGTENYDRDSESSSFTEHLEIDNLDSISSWYGPWHELQLVLDTSDRYEGIGAFKLIPLGLQSHWYVRGIGRILSGEPF